MFEIAETVDWQGRPVDCAACPHRELKRRSACELGRACMQDRYARRIDRFFTRNPELADLYLDHPHFEVRAIAARFASVFKLRPLLADEDETVRWSAVRRQIAARLPAARLILMRADPDWRVRYEAAHRAPTAEIAALIDDDDALARERVRERLSEQAEASA